MITDLKPYPAYIETGEQWLRNAPKHWELKRCKYLFRCIDVRSQAGEEELLTVSSQHGVLPRHSINVTMFKAESYTGYKLCWPGDLVINSLWAWARGLGVSRYHGIVSSAYGVYRPRSKTYINPRYIHELVRSNPFHWELRVRSKGIWTSRLQLTDDSFLNASIPIPPPSEQAAIVRFLDYMDRRIRRYIRAKQKLIKLLEEQKQVIIQQAVTRGLDPNVRLKPSGVEWLGDVPEHWEVKRLKFLLQNGIHGLKIGPFGSMLKLDETYQEGIKVYGQENVIYDDFSIGKRFVDEAKFNELSVYEIVAGDVLITMMGTSGRCAIVPNSAVMGIMDSHLLRLRPNCDFIQSKYLQIVIDLAHYTKLQIIIMGKGAIMHGINSAIIKSLIIAIPPHNEQELIADYINEHTSIINILINDAKQAILNVNEYRTTLISEVVTGKLDIREIAAQLPDGVEEADEFDEDEITLDNEIQDDSEDPITEAET